MFAELAMQSDRSAVLRFSSAVNNHTYGIEQGGQLTYLNAHILFRR
jgi:hypothetical protein